MTVERREALRAPREAARPMTAGEVAKEIGKLSATIAKMLKRMADDGDGVERVATGKYRAVPDQGEMDLRRTPSSTVEDAVGDTF